jgi:hypothetical protein
MRDVAADAVDGGATRGLGRAARLGGTYEQGDGRCEHEHESGDGGDAAGGGEGSHGFPDAWGSFDTFVIVVPGAPRERERAEWTSVRPPAVRGPAAAPLTPAFGAGDTNSCSVRGAV